MIKTKEVKTYVEQLYCDACGEQMFPDYEAGVLLTFPMKFPHKCPNCGMTTVEEKTYPNTIYKEIDENV